MHQQCNPVHWFEIYVQDMQRARKFYESVLGVQLVKLPATDFDIWTFPMHKDKPGSAGALVKMEGCPSGGNSTLIYFACADCAIEAARVIKAGGMIFKEKFSIGQYGFIALARDTEGNMFGMHSME